MTQSTMESLKCLEQTVNTLVNKIKTLELDKDTTKIEKLLDTLGETDLYFDEVPKSYFSNPRIMSKLVEKWPKLLEHATPEIKDDYDIVLKAVGMRGSVLQFASDRLKSNNTIACTAATSITGFEFASYQVRSDPNVVKYAINCYGHNFAYASEELRGNLEIVKLAVEKHKGAYFMASKEMQNHPEVLKLVGLE